MKSCRPHQELGSDGKSISGSLHSDEETHEPDSPEENDTIIEYAMESPQNIRWKLPARKLVIERKGQPSYGIEYGSKLLGQRNGRPRVRYMLVREVKPGSPASSTSLRRGDLVLSVNDHPIFQEEDSSAREKFGSRIKVIFRKADTDGTLRLVVQSPEEVSTNAGIRPPEIVLLPHLRNIVRCCPTFALSKLPYSKIFVIGEDSVLVTSKLFKRKRASAKTEIFQSFSRLIRRTEKAGRRPVFRLDPSQDSHKTWMRSDESLKQFVDQANERHPSKQYHHVEVVTLSHRRGVLNGVVASSCIAQNDVVLYQVDADRLSQEPDGCLQELGSIARRLYDTIGRPLPVIVVITTKDPNIRMEDREALRRILEQLPQNNCSIVNTVFLEKDGYHSSAPAEGEKRQPAGLHGDRCSPTTDILTEILETVWEQKFQQLYPARFLIYLELFWRMFHREQQRPFTRGQIQQDCQIQDRSEVPEFVSFLKVIGEVLIVRPDSVHEMLVRPCYILPFLRKLLMPPPLDQQSGTPGALWEMPTSLSFVTAASLENLFGSGDASAVVSAFQELAVLLPMTHFASETNTGVGELRERNREVFIVGHALGTSTSCRCIEGESERRLRVELESRVPLDFLERLVLKVIDNSKDKDPRWVAVGPCGCLEFIMRDGCAAVFQRDPWTGSVTIFPSLSGNYRPVNLLRLIRKSVQDLEVSMQGRAIVGTDCPRCEVVGRVHVLDIDPDVPESFVHCGAQRLDAHPRVTYWDSRMGRNTSPKNRRGVPPSSDPDDLWNLADDLYSSLCQRLNVPDTTFRKDWRMLAAKLGYSNEAIRQLNRPHCLEWDSCDQLLSGWMDTGEASITQLMSLLLEIERTDVTNHLWEGLRSSQPGLLNRIALDKPADVRRILEQLPQWQSVPGVPAFAKSAAN